MFLKYSIWDHWRFLWWGIPAILGFIFTYRDEFLPEKIQQKYQIINLIPMWEAETWIIIISLVVFVLFFEGSFKRYVTLEEKYEKLMIPTLALQFFPAQSSYITPEIQMRPKLFRISIRNISLKTAENVTVKLTRISSWPQATGVLPITLRKKDTENHSLYSFTINPQDNEFIDVLQISRVNTNRGASEPNETLPYFDFCFANQGDLKIPALERLGSPYEITIEVTGDGIIGDRRNFILCEKNGEFFMNMLSDGGLETCSGENTSA